MWKEIWATELTDVTVADLESLDKHRDVEIPTDTDLENLIADINRANGNYHQKNTIPIKFMAWIWLLLNREDPMWIDLFGLSWWAPKIVTWSTHRRTMASIACKKESQYTTTTMCYYSYRLMAPSETYNYSDIYVYSLMGTDETKMFFKIKNTSGLKELTKEEHQQKITHPLSYSRSTLEPYIKALKNSSFMEAWPQEDDDDTERYNEMWENQPSLPFKDDDGIKKILSVDDHWGFDEVLSRDINESYMEMISCMLALKGNWRQRIDMLIAAFPHIFSWELTEEDWSKIFTAWWELRNWKKKANLTTILISYKIYLEDLPLSYENAQNVLWVLISKIT